MMSSKYEVNFCQIVPIIVCPNALQSTVKTVVVKSTSFLYEVIVKFSKFLILYYETESAFIIVNRYKSHAW